VRTRKTIGRQSQQGRSVALGYLEGDIMVFQDDKGDSTVNTNKTSLIASQEAAHTGEFYPKSVRCRGDLEKILQISEYREICGR
jgi:hypothetical protein